MGEMENCKRKSDELGEGLYETDVGGKDHTNLSDWIALTELFLFLEMWQILLAALPTTITLSSWN